MSRTTSRFWLLQALGWLPFLLLQLMLSTDDLPRSEAVHVVSAIALCLLAIGGSLVLRAIYRGFLARIDGDLGWLALVAGASLSLALMVDAIYYAGLWLLSGAGSSVEALYAAQPLFARAPLVALMYVLWSVLYLAMSRQQRLQAAATAHSELQLALKEAQIQRLLGQLSPHFTFNAINNIRALILQDAEAARSLLAKFAATLRYQFANPEAALVSVDEEMAVVRDYIDLLRLQLGSRLGYQERVEPAASSWQVPRFALQLLVENAIKHGLATSPVPGLLAVEVGVQDGVLQMDVRNTGVLGDRAKSSGIGLDNLEQRLRLAFGNAASLSLQQEGELVLARVRIGERT